MKVNLEYTHLFQIIFFFLLIFFTPHLALATIQENIEFLPKGVMQSEIEIKNAYHIAEEKYLAAEQEHNLGKRKKLYNKAFKFFKEIAQKDYAIAQFKVGVLDRTPKRYWLWRALDSQDQEIDILLQPRRNTQAAKRLFCKLLGKEGFIPRVIITDKLASYKAGLRKLGLSLDHRRHKSLNNRLEGSHQHARKQERVKRQFRNPINCQKFLSLSLRGSIKNAR